MVPLFYYLVGASEHRRRNCYAQSVRGPEIDHQIKFGRPLDRKIGWASAMKNLENESACPANHVGQIRTIRNQSTACRKAPKRRYSRDVRICQRCPLAARSGGTDRFRPRNNSEIYLFSDRQRVINFNAEIPDGALDLGMAKQ
jgi:hypothetical protein